MNNLTVENSNAITSLKQWLNTETALPVLKAVARNLLSWAKDANILHEILGVDHDEKAPELGVSSFVMEVLFDPDRLESCRIQLAKHIDDGNLNSVKTILTSRVINYCIDERRKEQNSPFHFWFRRMSTALSNSGDDIRYVLHDIGKKTVPYYAISQVLDLPFLSIGILGADDFRGWPNPGFAIAEVKTPQLLAISHIFWDRALDELNNEHFLPVKDLVQYLSVFYRFERYIQSESAAALFDDDKEKQSMTNKLHKWQPHDGLGTLERQHRDATKRLLQPEIEAAALRLAASWHPRTQAACYLNLVCDLSLKQTAERIGLNSPQAVAPYVVKAKSSLQEFFRQWHIEGYGSEDEQKTVLRMLIDLILKNCPECRNEE